MTRYVNTKVLCRRMDLMNHKTLLVFLVIVCSCVLVTGCLPTSIPAKGWSGPLAYNGSIYVGSMDMKAVALDVVGDNTNAYMKWRRPVDTSIAYVYGDPAIYGDKLYLGFYYGASQGRVYSFELERGYEDLVYPDAGYIGAIVGSPVIVDGIIYVGSSDKKLYAINATTRQLAWQPFETDGKIWSTPVVYNGTVYVGSFDHKIYAISADDGTLDWTFDTDGAIVDTPLIYNDTLYFGSLDEKFYAVDVSTGTLREGFAPFKADNWFWSKAVAYNSSIIAASLDGKIYSLDADTGTLIWQAQAGGSIRGAPALVGNLVIVGTDEGNNTGKVYCFNADNGERVWDYPSEGGPIPGAIHASIGSNGSVVYVHATNQKIYAIDAEQGTILWSISTGGGQ